MKIGINLGSQNHLPPDDLVRMGQLAAGLGFDSVWTTHQARPTPFDLCGHWAAAMAARNATGTDIGIAVIPAPQWQPEVVASHAVEVSKSLPGSHFILGIGTGGYGQSFWADLDMPNRPIAIMREYVDFFRTALRGGAVDYEGEFIKVRDFALDIAPRHVPIYLAALGPQMMRLVGSCADGVITNWASPAAIAANSGILAEGARAAGRKRSDVSLAANIRCCVDEDVDAARRVLARRILEKVIPTSERRVSEGSLGYRGQFVRLGFEEEITQLEQRHRAGASREDLTDKVSAEFCAAAGYFGTARDVAARLAELSRGLDEMILRVETVRPGVEPLMTCIEAVAPQEIRMAKDLAAKNAADGEEPDIS